MTPSARTLDYLRKQGYKPATVERWNPHVKIRQDLYGFIDIIAIHPEKPGVLAIQVTTGAHLADRKAKSLANDKLPVWLAGGNRFELHGWRKVGPRGKRKLWEVLIDEVQPQAIQPVQKSTEENNSELFA